MSISSSNIINKSITTNFYRHIAIITEKSPNIAIGRSNPLKIHRGA